MEGNLKETERKKVIRQLHEVLKEEQDNVPVGTSYEQRAQWISAKTGQVAKSEVREASGNTANVISVATSHAAKVSHEF